MEFGDEFDRVRLSLLRIDSIEIKSILEAGLIREKYFRNDLFEQPCWNGQRRKLLVAESQNCSRETIMLVKYP